MPDQGSPFELQISIAIRSLTGEELPAEVKLENIHLQCSCCRELKPVLMAFVHLDSNQTFIFCADCRNLVSAALIEICAGTVQKHESTFRRLQAVPTNSGSPN
jgi:hypothetical protein